jgi:hypothetical protein
MKAWVIAEGKPMICGIFCDGSDYAYIYFKEGKEIMCRTLESKIKGRYFWAKWEGNPS